MSFVTDTWRQLVRRRLWPVALLLLAALAAVPFLLAKDPEPAVVAAAPAGAAGKTTLAEDTSDPIVTVADAAGAEGSPRRRVLGSSKDPFEPAPAKKVKAKSAQVAGTATPDPTEAPSSSSGGSPASSGGDSTPSTGPVTTPLPTSTPTPEAKEKKTYPLYSLAVRFGDSSTTAARSRVTRLEALPDADNPLLVYLGVKDGGKAAVFMLDSSVTPQGDGECEPSPADCETLVLREGETEFFDVAGEDENASGSQFQLDLIDINTKQSKTRESKGLKSVKVGGSLRYRYNARKGTLRQLGLHTRHTRSANAESAVVGG
jgi:hypothetical protein